MTTSILVASRNIPSKGAVITHPVGHTAFLEQRLEWKNGKGIEKDEDEYNDGVRENQSS